MRGELGLKELTILILIMMFAYILFMIINNMLGGL